MKKRILPLLLAMTVLVSSVPVMAANIAFTDSKTFADDSPEETDMAMKEDDLTATSDTQDMC